MWKQFIYGRSDNDLVKCWTAYRKEINIQITLSDNEKNSERGSIWDSMCKPSFSSREMEQ